MVQDPDAQPLHAGALAAHVLGALEIVADLAAVGVNGEWIPLHPCEFVHPGVGLVEDPGHPAAVGEVAAERLPAGHRRFAQLRLILDIPDAGAYRRGGAA